MGTVLCPMYYIIQTHGYKYTVHYIISYVLYYADTWLQIYSTLYYVLCTILYRHMVTNIHYTVLCPMYYTMKTHGYKYTVHCIMSYVLYYADTWLQIYSTLYYILCTILGRHMVTNIQYTVL